jgi:hypothetical protein
VDATPCSSILDELQKVPGDISRDGSHDASCERSGAPVFWRPYAWSAAALVLGAALLAGVFFASRPGPDPAPGAAPSPPSDLSLTLTLEEEAADVQFVPGEDGSPMRQETERVRRFTFPVHGKGGPGNAGQTEQEEGRGMGVERVNTRAVRLVNWPVR